MMTDTEWRAVQETTGMDIMDIVMNFSRGLETAGRTMELIAEYCDACYEAGVKKATGLFLHTREENQLMERRIETYEKAVARLQGWVADLQSGMHINCVYCGHRYGPKESTPVSMADILKAHIEVCPEHPMSKLKIENEDLRADIQTLLDTLHRMDNIFKRYETRANTVNQDRNLSALQKRYEANEALIKENAQLIEEIEQLKRRGALNDCD